MQRQCKKCPAFSPANRLRAAVMLSLTHAMSPHTMEMIAHERTTDTVQNGLRSREIASRISEYRQRRRGEKSGDRDGIEVVLEQALRHWAQH